MGVGSGVTGCGEGGGVTGLGVGSSVTGCGEGSGVTTVDGVGLLEGSLLVGLEEIGLDVGLSEGEAVGVAVTTATGDGVGSTGADVGLSVIAHLPNIDIFSGME